MLIYNSQCMFGYVASLLCSFACCKPTNQRAAHLYIHEHTMNEKKTLGKRRHRTAARAIFSPTNTLHTVFGDLKEQCEIPPKPSQSPLYIFSKAEEKYPGLGLHLS